MYLPDDDPVSVETYEGHVPNNYLLLIYDLLDQIMYSRYITARNMNYVSTFHVTYTDCCRRHINLLKPTGHVMHSTTVRSAHTVFMCFVFI